MKIMLLGCGIGVVLPLAVLYIFDPTVAVLLAFLSLS